MINSLEVEAVKSGLSTKWVGQNYVYFEELGSTNAALKKMASVSNERELPAGTVILTNFQSQGRGRFDRSWEAPPGSSLLFSILFRPDWSLAKCNWLTMLASLAIVEVIDEQTTLTAHLKWPNDVVLQVDGTWHKVAGLLLETGLDHHGRCQTAVLGMGINLNIPQPQLPHGRTPPASLLSASGQIVPRLPFLLDLLARLELRYEAVVNGRSPQPAWQQKLITLGQPVTITNDDQAGRISGTAVATDVWGQLIVEADDGRVHTVAAGDVTLRG